MPTLLVFSERASTAFELLSKGRQLATELKMTLAVALVGASATDPSEKAKMYSAYGAQKVFVAQIGPLDQFIVEQHAEALKAIVQASGATVMLIGSTRRGKELAGRLAQKLDCGAVTDAIGLTVKQGQIQIDRYALGGNTVATDVITTDRQVIGVMPRTFEALPQPTSAEVVPVQVQVPAPRLRVVERKPKPSATANIETADSLVVIGKGFAKREDIQIAQALATALQAELGCTRTLSADYHWLDEERMVGISGKKCKPRLLISVGVSGQIQHTVGILSSKLIVAINKDKAAPIFKIADYGIVGDLYQIVPQLIDRVNRK